VCNLVPTNIAKGIENIFIKPLARKKRLCIFALGFTRSTFKTVHSDKQYHFKDTKQ
jgi:hypothetical protein